jgi:hypothetical protein
VIVFAWILLARIAQAEGACQKADALDIACKIATKVDREISALRFALQVFTTYRSIDSAGSPSGWSVMGSGILRTPVIWAEGAAGWCTLRNRRRDGLSPSQGAVAAAGVCRSRQTASAAHSNIVPSARTTSRSRQGRADVVRRARGA